MPGFEINREAAFAFSATLVYITRRVIETRNIGTIPLDVPFVPRIYEPVARTLWIDKSDSAGRLRDFRGLFQRIVNPVNLSSCIAKETR
jgi:hypothetical protein